MWIWVYGVCCEFGVIGVIWSYGYYLELLELVCIRLRWGFGFVGVLVEVWYCENYVGLWELFGV